MKNTRSLLASLFGMVVGQAFIVFVLFFVCNVITFLTYFFAGYAIAGFITFSVYAVIWWFIWRSLYGENGIPQFYTKLTFGTIPLIVFTVTYILLHPTPNYSMMIPTLPAEIHFYFATAVTATLMFPLYAFA